MFLTRRQCGRHFFVEVRCCKICKLLKHWAVEWRNVKWYDWQIKCLSKWHSGRYLSRFNIPTNAWLTAGIVFLKLPIVYSILGSEESENLGCILLIFNLKWQIRVCCEVVFRLCLEMFPINLRITIRIALCERYFRMQISNYKDGSILVD